MFPISDSIKAARFPFLNLVLIGVNVYVFYLEITSSNVDSFIQTFSLIPANVHLNNPVTLIPFITGMFLHGGFMHIISNMWFLKVFGDNVEGHMNPLTFLLLYFGAGTAGFLVQYLTMPTSSIPMLGASGAVAGILGAYFVLFPHSRVRTFVPIFFFFTLLTIPAVFMLGYWFVLQLLSGFGTLGQPVNQGGIAFWAHIVGFIVGMVFGKLLKGNESQVQEAELLGYTN
jgi:membrane associated rhomboid family serine protease